MKTILLIDDDDLCREPVAELLRHHDWHVIEARDGEEGIAMAVQHRPDVIISDLLMPNGNGFAVCRAVRSHIELRSTRLVVMTGRDYPDDRKNATEAGADHFVLKPLNLEELEKLVGNSVTAGVNGKTPPPVAEIEEGHSEMVLRFWGVRGSIPTPGSATAHFGGNTSCIEIRSEGELIICDAGTGIRPLGISLAEEFKDQALNITLLITHTHWDHIQGFPFFRPAYNPKNQVRILGYEGACASLANTLAGQMESPYFPISLKQMPGNLKIEELRDMEFSVGNVKVTSCFSKHPGVCVGYRLHTAAGSIVYMPDNEWAAAESAAAQVEPCTQENILLDFIRGADIVILDAQYDRAEYESHKGWGHGCVDEVVRFAELAGVKQLFLFHHDPEHDDVFVDKLVEKARRLANAGGSGLKVDAAREGDRIVLKAPRPAQ